MKRFSVLDRALRSVAVQLRSWVVHERVHVYQCGTDFENTTLVHSRSQIDSTLSPKEGKWHQQRRRPRRSVLQRRRPRRSVQQRRRPRRSVQQRRRPRRSVLLLRRLPLGRSKVPSGICDSRGAYGPPRTPLPVQIVRLVNVEAPGAVGNQCDRRTQSLGLASVQPRRVRAVGKMEVQSGG